MLRRLTLLLIAFALSWGVAVPTEMLVIGGIHHYWPLIPALGYGAIFFISLLGGVIAFFYGVGKVLAEMFE